MKLVCITNKDYSLYRYAVTKNCVYDIVEEGRQIWNDEHVKIVDDENKLNWLPRKLFKTLVECRKDKINRIYEVT